MYPIKRVAVVGAGPIGVSTAKYLAGEKAFTKIDVYEQQSGFGGAWIWTQPQADDELVVPQTSPFGPLDKVHLHPRDALFTDVKPPVVMTPMYDNLETNIPHDLMTFEERPYPDGVPLFPSRTEIMNYLEDYGEEVKHLIKFSTQVVQLSWRQDGKSAACWLLRSKNLLSGEEVENEYDAVALANGHFALPNLPEVAGIQQWNTAYPGSIMHAKWYRNPKQFAGKKVVVVGNASSGIDIGSQIATQCKSPIIISARSEPLFKLPDFVEHRDVPSIVEFISPTEGRRSVRFADGSVEEDVDIVLFCTGYLMNFPFLQPEVQKELVSTGSMVHGTYKHLIWRQNPSLCFLGLPMKILPLPLGEAQAAVVARVWSGRIDVPSRAEMNVWELERWRTQAELLKSRDIPVNSTSLEKSFHSMGYPQDLDYHNDLVSWASQAPEEEGKTLPRPMGEREYWLRTQMVPMKKAFADLRDNRRSIKTLEDLGFDWEKHKAEERLEAERIENGILADLATNGTA